MLTSGPPPLLTLHQTRRGGGGARTHRAARLAAAAPSTPGLTPQRSPAGGERPQGRPQGQVQINKQGNCGLGGRTKKARRRHRCFHEGPVPRQEQHQDARPAGPRGECGARDTEAAADSPPLGKLRGGSCSARRPRRRGRSLTEAEGRPPCETSCRARRAPRCLGSWHERCDSDCHHPTPCDSPAPPAPAALRGPACGPEVHTPQGAEWPGGARPLGLGGPPREPAPGPRLRCGRAEGQRALSPGLRGRFSRGFSRLTLP